MQIIDVKGVTRANAYNIPTDELREGPHSRRWADQDILELALDIVDRGQIVAALVRWRKDDQAKEYLEIVEGNRRVAAIRYINENGLSPNCPLPVRCELFRGAESFAASVAANIKRKGLSPIDRAHSIATLEKEGKSRKEIAKLLEVSEALISRDLTLLTLSVALQKDVHKGKLSAEVGYELASLTPEDRTKALESGVTPAGKTESTGQSQLSTEAKPVREAVRRLKREKAERGEDTKGSTARSRKEVYNLFSDYAGCQDGTIEDPIKKLCAAIVAYMDGKAGDRAVLNRMRELAEGE